MEENKALEYMSVYPITISIMNGLSASDVSAFLHATRIYRICPSNVARKYMNIERDMLDIMPWIRSRQTQGDEIVLAGKDLDHLMDRYNNPLIHWTKDLSKRTYKLCISILSATSRRAQYHEVVDPEIGPDQYSRAWIDINGRIDMPHAPLVNGLPTIHPDELDCKGSVCKSRIPLLAVVLPGPNLWPECCENWKRGRVGEWEVHPTSNQSRVTIMSINGCVWSQGLYATTPPEDESDMFISRAVNRHKIFDKILYMKFGTGNIKEMAWGRPGQYAEEQGATDALDGDGNEPIAVQRFHYSLRPTYHRPVPVVWGVEVAQPLEF